MLTRMAPDSRPAELGEELEALVAPRRDLHAHPEVRFTERRTAGRVAERRGRSQSVLADRVELTGTIRSVDEDVRQRLKLALEQVASGIAAAAGARIALEWANEMPPVRNDRRLETVPCSRC